jgi:photosystem II stability/assembly factor-like uncharacterized protein
VRTTNAGQDWIQQSSGTTRNLRDVFFSSVSIGTAVGSYGTILHTTDDGINWSEQLSSTNSALWGIHLTDEIGTAVGVGGTILNTTDGGLNWVSQTSGISSTLYDVHFIDGLTGHAVGAYGSIVHTTDSGVNWFSQSSGTTETLLGVYFMDNNNGTIVGEKGTIIHTTDGGINWVNQSSRTLHSIFDVNFSDINNGTVIGLDGTILHTTNGGVTFVEDEISSSQPKVFHLLQNYPNPFNPSTSIQYAVSSRQFVSLKVYDVLGNEIATLINEDKPAGSYEVEFLGKELPSGIYFYQLHTSDYIETKKMVLTK